MNSVKFPITIVVSNHPKYGSITYTIEEHPVETDEGPDIKNEIIVFIKTDTENPVEYYRSLTPVSGIFEVEESLYEGLYRIFSHMYNLGVTFYTRRNWVTVKFLIQHFCLDILFQIIERKETSFLLDGSKPDR